jgi:hypothetical protein
VGWPDSIFQDVFFVGEENATKDNKHAGDQEKHEDGCACGAGFQPEEQERKPPPRNRRQQRFQVVNDREFLGRTRKILDHIFPTETEDQPEHDRFFQDRSDTREKRCVTHQSQS